MYWSEIEVADILIWSLGHTHVPLICSLGHDHGSINDQPMFEAFVRKLMKDPMGCRVSHILEPPLYPVCPLLSSPEELREKDNLQRSRAAVHVLRFECSINGLKHDFHSPGDIFTNSAASQIALVHLGMIVETAIYFRSGSCKQVHAQVLDVRVLLSIDQNHRNRFGWLLDFRRGSLEKTVATEAKQHGPNGNAAMGTLNHSRKNMLSERGLSIQLVIRLHGSRAFTI